MLWSLKASITQNINIIKNTQKKTKKLYYNLKNIHSLKLLLYFFKFFFKASDIKKNTAPPPLSSHPKGENNMKFSFPIKMMTMNINQLKGEIVVRAVISGFIYLYRGSYTLIIELMLY